MKSEIEYHETNDKQEYPYLGVFDDYMVVLFTAPCRGMCVHAGYDIYSIGDESDDWAEEDAEKLIGKVTLSND